MGFWEEGIGYTSSVHTVTMTNSGSAALTLTGIAVSGLQSAEFQQTNDCGSGIASGAHCTVSITFSPQATGVRTAAIQIADNAYNSPQIISLSGKGAAPLASASLVPSTINFGNGMSGRPVRRSRRY